MEFSGNKGLKLKSGGACPKNHAIPDAPSPPRNCASSGAPTPGCPATASPWSSRSTSTKPGADREAKRRCYARGGIPLYLLVDRDASS